MKTFLHRILRALRTIALIAVFALAFFINSIAHAILDAQNNGMSDLWEKQYNNGNLFPASFLPTDDPDQDGWTNITEAIAGTDPHLANPPNGIIATTIEPTGTEGVFTLTWPTIIGKNYRLQASSDLTNWLNVGTAVVGTTNSHTLGISAVQPDTTVPPKLFWRIVASDLDTDKDGLTNAEENTFGSNPNSVDSDGDKLSDRKEAYNGSDANLSDTDGDGYTDYIETFFGTNSQIATSKPFERKVFKRSIQYDYSLQNTQVNGYTNIAGSWTTLNQGYISLNASLSVSELRQMLADFEYPTTTSGNLILMTDVGSNKILESSSRSNGGNYQNVYIEQLRTLTTIDTAVNGACKFYYLLRNCTLTESGIQDISFEHLEQYIQQGETTSEPLDIISSPISDSVVDGIEVKEASLIAVELLSDLNNDGKIDASDRVLRDAAKSQNATPDTVKSGTEFIFVNDNLSNGIWDAQDSDANRPVHEVEDDDAQALHVTLEIDNGEAWFDHPAINNLSFYSSKECKPADVINIKDSNRFKISESNRLPPIIFVRCDDSNLLNNAQEMAGVLELKFREEIKSDDNTQNNSAFSNEVSALGLNFTIVKGLGAASCFIAAADYIGENNSRLCAFEKSYTSGSYKIVTMLNDKTSMYPIDAARRPNGGQLKGVDAVAAAYPDISVIINGNQCFFADDTNSILAGVSGAISDKCHGRIVRFGNLDADVSSDNYDESTKPSGSVLAGPEPLPGMSATDPKSRGGNFIAQYSSGVKFRMEAGRVPLVTDMPPAAYNPVAAMGGLSANAARRQVREEVQSIGLAPILDNKEMLFVASQSTGGGHAVDLKNDAEDSGVEALPGGRSGEIKLLFLDGSSSVALNHTNGSDKLQNYIKGHKHGTTAYYYINTYLLFRCEKPRP